MDSYITNGLTNTIDVDGEPFIVNTSFKVWLQVARLLLDEEHSPDNIAKCLSIVYDRLPTTLDAALNGIFSFLFPADKLPNKKKPKTNKKRTFSFYYDEEYIIADFQRYYNIDLFSVDMHWHRFLVLFRGLPSDGSFKSVVEIREKKISDITDKKLKSEYRKLKAIYALPDNRTDREKEQELADLLI